MVRRLWGKCQGSDISFQLVDSEAGRWEATVPASDTGYYIIELWAEDEAGNVGYYATVKLTIDLDTMQTSVTILQVASGVSVEEVAHTLGIEEYVQCSVRDLSDIFTRVCLAEIRSSVTSIEV
jgi:predicted carbohydrate-binding protein with CBM5 and CBM33 domain